MFKKASIILLSIILLFVTGCSNNNVVINNIDDLENKKIGICTGSEYDIIATEKIKNPNLNFYNNYSDQVAALKSNKIDGFLADEPLAREILKENEGLKILDGKLTEDSYAFAINPKEEKLQHSINEVMEQLKKNGKLKEFEEKWFGSDESKKELEEYNYDDSKGTLKFGTVSGSAPFSYMKNNEVVGYDIDVIKYISKELGYKLEIVEMSFEGLLPALVSGKAQVAGCSIIVTEERKKSVLFSIPDYTGGIVIVTRDK